ncbi:Multidrug resistance protein B [Pseudomonas sp. R4-35-07]|nr:Multidrug resistance protein B [Pseudomonas sp. R2-60-08W]AZF33520.1 Multidrug resistance protein B [Pseudomonas sp. R4-35-07]
MIVIGPVICGYLLINAALASMVYALAALTAAGGTLCFLSGRWVAGSC